MIKIKTILPTLKEKKRYLVYGVISDKKINFDDAKEAVNKAILQFLGELGYAKAGIIILSEWKKNKGILRINHKEVDKVKTALCLIEKINNEAVIVRTIGVSGILKKAREKFL